MDTQLCDQFQEWAGMLARTASKWVDSAVADTEEAFSKSNVMVLRQYLQNEDQCRALLRFAELLIHILESTPSMGEVKKLVKASVVTRTDPRSYCPLAHAPETEGIAGVLKKMNK